jgi:hypothetical protein
MGHEITMDKNVQSKPEHRGNMGKTRLRGLEDVE